MRNIFFIIYTPGVLCLSLVLSVVSQLLRNTAICRFIGLAIMKKNLAGRLDGGFEVAGICGGGVKERDIGEEGYEWVILGISLT